MDIVILTPLLVEYIPVRGLLTDISTESKDNHLYEVGAFKGVYYDYQVAIRQTGSKIAALALATEKAIQHYRPSLMLLLGVAGGIKDVDLGDIVVGTKAYGYEFGKESADGFKSRPEAMEFDEELVEFLTHFAKQEAWLQEAQTLEFPTVHFGPIASGNKVVANDFSSSANHIKENFNDTLAIEMEAIGFAKATARYPDVRIMNIRGVSDLLSGKGKADRTGSQEAAMRHVVAFTKVFLNQLNFPNYKRIIMTHSELAEHVTTLLFKHLQPNFRQPEQSALAKGTPGTLVEMWPILESFIVEGIADEGSKDAGRIAAKASLRTTLKQDEQLFIDLNEKLQKHLRHQKSVLNKPTIRQEKNVIKDSTIRVGGNFHLGDQTINNKH